MKILVTGATGAVGPCVVKAFHDAGYNVRTMSRRQAPGGMFPTGVETLCGDVTDESAVEGALEGIQTIIHLAAFLHSVNPTEAEKNKYQEINIDGTARLTEAACKAGVGRILLFSSICVYGPTRGKVLDETSPATPDTLYSKSKLAAERIVLDATDEDGNPVGTVLRLAAVYGSRVKANYLRLVRSLSRGMFIPIGDGQNRRTLIHEQDVARAALHTVENANESGRIYNVTDGGYHSMGEIIDTICSALGNPPPRLSVPVTMARFLSGILEDGFSVVGRQAPVTRSHIEKFVEDVAIDGRRIQQELGFVPMYDLNAGWAETVRQMRLQGEI